MTKKQIPDHNFPQAFSDNNAEVCTQAELLATLRRQRARRGLSPRPRIRPGITTLSRKVSIRDLTVFTRQLATLVEADLPVLRALDLLASQLGRHRLQTVVVTVADRVREGTGLAASLAVYPAIFNDLYVSLVRVGETAGLLPEVLLRLAEHLEKTEELRRKVRGAFLYPAIILVVAVGATLGLLVAVIPLFARMFQEAGVPLPGPTRMVIDLSEMLEQHFLWLMPATILAVVLTRLFLARPRSRLLCDRLKLHLPLLGNLFASSAVARFTRSLGTLLDSGVTILTALDCSGEMLGNRYWQQAIAEAIGAVARGEDLAGSLAATGCFPAMLIHGLGVGEKAGRLPAVLARLAAYYEYQTEAGIQILTTVLEPLLIVVIALVIGAILVAMYLPIFSLSEVVG